jgi:hypothetical protein
MANADNRSFMPSTPEHVVDLSDAYTVPTVFNAINHSPAARIASVLGTNIVADLIRYVRDNHKDIWQTIDR